MKKNIALIIFLLTLLSGFAQAQNNIGINNANPSASAALMVDTASSGPQGMLIPRMTQARRNAIPSPAEGLMIYQTDGTKGFYFYNGTAWTSPGSTGGAVLDLVATKIAAIQTPASANGTNTGDVIIFDNVNTAPVIGSYNAVTNVYTAGAAGLYLVQVRSLSVDNSPATNTVGHWFKIEITPSGGSASFINNRDVYGPYPATVNANFPSGLKGRSEICAVIQLNSGDSFVIKGLSANSSVTNSIKNDGSCKLTVIKMN